MRIVRTTALMTATSAICLALTAPALAEGKSAAGCASGGWQLAYYVTSDNLASAPTAPVQAVLGDLVNVPDNSIELLNHVGITSGLFTSEGIDVLAIFKSVDKNGDGDLCYKLPNGWNGPQPANKTDLLSIGDNK
jgi:hypothetical protein